MTKSILWAGLAVVLAGMYVLSAGNVYGCEYLQEVVKNPKERKSFLAHFNYAKSLPLMLYGEFKEKNEHLYRQYTVQGKQYQIDRMSFGCLECHGEMLTVGMNLARKEVLEKNFHSLFGKHPIGVDYNDLARDGAGTYLRPDPERNNVVFVGGKLGCLSCHNPFSRHPSHLNAPVADDSLCKECHRR